MAMTDVATHHEFRIEILGPGEDVWHYRTLTGFASRDLDVIRQRLADAIVESADGWRYRLVMRVVSMTATPWIEP